MVSKRGKAEKPSSERESGRRADHRPQLVARDQDVIERIRQHAYLLFLAAGGEHGHDVEHWLEAERQIMGSSDRL
jgi:hypothetical protein